MKRIVIIGGGFAGMWSAVGAARKLHELQIEGNEVEVVLINRDSFLGLRPRFYEKDPHHYRIPLSQVLEPAGVSLIEGEVGQIDTHSQKVMIHQNREQIDLTYDRLVFAAGSQLVRPNIVGLYEHAFSTDTYQDAIDLDKHINGLPDLPYVEGKYTAVIVGGGFTGIEIAAEMTSRLKEIARKENKESEVRIVLIERESVVGPDMGANPRPIIEEALGDMHIEIYVNETVTSIGSDRVTLKSGKRIPSLTTIWAAGIKPSPLAKYFPVEKDEQGRLPVDSYLRIEGLPYVFAAGDTARAQTDENHISLMSCQHAMPQGKFAGHNVVCDLLGLTGIPYKQERYVTCLDLGQWGALFTNGWDRIPQYQGEEAKRTKRNTNQSKIYPPLSGNREEIFDAAAPHYLVK
ncbi:NAD(P)/FAD-dependent oxidoreductase [Alteribacillus bidgolensis]|uniref:NADH dehydrogenase n=1 Tax=Alteribacillus bidgolensis TaxID=930129 RepID=A0A1G8RCR6_9BACI|nr:NAD(P)/FAD-dependent oxidoreductase [Alteribacillus bidgolensis]SDJ14719.1 NADH dehydrogenase [Alteribacillus bidgolensis]